jgi:hypothetical protein
MKPRKRPKTSFRHAMKPQNRPETTFHHAVKPQILPETTFHRAVKPQIRPETTFHRPAKPVPKQIAGSRRAVAVRLTGASALNTAAARRGPAFFGRFMQARHAATQFSADSHGRGTPYPYVFRPIHINKSR